MCVTVRLLNCKCLFCAKDQFASCFRIWTQKKLKDEIGASKVHMHRCYCNFWALLSIFWWTIAVWDFLMHIQVTAIPPIDTQESTCLWKKELSETVPIWLLKVHFNFFLCIFQDFQKTNRWEHQYQIVKTKIKFRHVVQLKSLNSFFVIYQNHLKFLTKGEKKTSNCRLWNWVAAKLHCQKKTNLRSRLKNIQNKHFLIWIFFFSYMKLEIMLIVKPARNFIFRLILTEKDTSTFWLCFDENQKVRFFFPYLYVYSNCATFGSQTKSKSCLQVLPLSPASKSFLISNDKPFCT